MVLSPYVLISIVHICTWCSKYNIFLFFTLFQPDVEDYSSRTETLSTGQGLGWGYRDLKGTKFWRYWLSCWPSRRTSLSFILYVPCLFYSGLGSYFQDSFWNAFDNRVSPNILAYICITMSVWQEIQLKNVVQQWCFVNHMEIRIAFCSYILYNVAEQSLTWIFLMNTH